MAKADTEADAAARRRDPWHLTIWTPLGVILALLLQFGSFVWFAAKMDGRVSQTELEINRIDDQVINVTRQVGSNRDLASRIDERIISVQRSLDKIERKLDRPERFPQ